MPNPTDQTGPLQPVLRRRLISLAAFALSVLFMYGANRLAADDRYLLALFCFSASISSFAIGLYFLSRRLAEIFSRLVLEAIEFFVG